MLPPAMQASEMIGNFHNLPSLLPKTKTGLAVACRPLGVTVVKINNPSSLVEDCLLTIIVKQTMTGMQNTAAVKLSILILLS